MEIYALRIKPEEQKETENKLFIRSNKSRV